MLRTNQLYFQYNVEIAKNYENHVNLKFEASLTAKH